MGTELDPDVGVLSHRPSVEESNGVPKGARSIRLLFSLSDVLGPPLLKQHRDYACSTATHATNAKEAM